ncbi:baseplate assembly protein [Roseibium sp.]|uniref:baseplate assembly protein n=1 Tax=Roseibium sp. TaxID=1936156 RepID=UPI003B52D003
MLHEILIDLRTDLEMLRTAFGNSLKVGPISEVDAEKGYRIKWGEGANGPYLSPWYPHPESGGQTSTWFPLSVDQIVGVMHPHGDMRQGVMFRGGFSEKNPPQSQDLELNLYKALGVLFTVKDGVLTINGDLVVKGNVDLGDLGGQKVARIGDRVDVKEGSSQGLWEIVEGSSLVKAAG